MKYIFNTIFLASVGLLISFSSCNNSSVDTTTEEETTESETPIVESDTQVIPLTPQVDTNKTRKQDTVLIKTTSGNITVVLYNETPLHRDNFLKHVREKYYDGVIFHRVMKNFMIQTGDPTSKAAVPGAQYGGGGPDYKVPAEINPAIKHTNGALAAARDGNPQMASSGSQFYICHGATPQLDGQYTVFGQTIEGLEVVDKIASAPIVPNSMGDGSGRPVKDVKIISMSLVTYKNAKTGKASKKNAKAATIEPVVK
jgi:cyclophilin family peptidyl-prolyl cis-trans isomerase